MTYKNTKLRGLKKIMKEHNITPEKLSMDINLINNSGINFVITPEYIEDISTNIQNKLDKTLVQILAQYFNVEVEDILHLRRNKQKEKCTKIITIKYDLIIDTNIQHLTCNLSINKQIDDDFIQKTMYEVIKRFGKITDKNEFSDYVQVVDNILTIYGTYISLNNKLLKLDEQDIFIFNQLNELEYGNELGIMRLMGCAYKYFTEDLHIDDRQAQTLATALLDVLLHNGEL